MSDPNNDISPEELEFRKSEYPDDEDIVKKKSIDCTICKKDLRKAILKKYEISIHPALHVLICDDCEEFYGDGEFSVDEDGSDKYCRWCGEGGNLYCCSNCSGALCSKCVKKNLPKAYTKEIERDDWRCLTCDPKPIWSYRALCASAKSFLDNRVTTQRSKRTRKAVSSDNDSDKDVFVKRTKKSRRESPSDDSRNDTEDKHWKKPKGAEVKDANNLKPFCISLPKAKFFESDGESSSTSAVKKETLDDTDSEESSAPSSATRKSRRVTKLKVAFPPPPKKRQESDDSDESSTSPVKKTATKGRRRSQDSEDSFTTTSTGKTTKSGRRSRKENRDSEDSPSTAKTTRNSRRSLREKRDSEDSPSTGKTTRNSRRSCRQNLDSEDGLPTTPSKKKISKVPEKEKNLLFLLLKDTSKDLNKFSKVVASSTKQFEEKFLKKGELDQKKLSVAKDKLHQLLQDTSESIMALQNSYSNALKTLDDDGKIVDSVEREIVDAVNGHRTDDEETGKVVTKKDSADESFLENSTVENSDMDATVESEKGGDAVDEGDSSQKEQNIVEESENDKLNLETPDDSKALSENTVNESATDASLVVQPSLSSPEVSIADSFLSATDDPENSTKTSTNQKDDNQSSMEVDVEPEPMDDEDLEKSKTTNPSHQNRKTKHNGKANENQDSCTLTDTEKNGKDENQSKVSGDDLLKSIMDEVKSKKSTRANELSDDDADRPCNPMEEPDEDDTEDKSNSILNESSAKEDKAKNSLLSSSSDNDESETESRNAQLSTNHDQKMVEQSEVKEKLTGETRTSLHCTIKKESSEDDEGNKSDNNLNKSSFIFTTKKENKAKKFFFSPSSDSDENSGTDSQEVQLSTKNSVVGMTSKKSCRLNDDQSEVEKIGSGETPSSPPCNPEEEPGEDDAENKSTNDNGPDESSFIFTKKEDKAKKFFFSPSSDDDEKSETDSQNGSNKKKMNSDEGKALEKSSRSSDDQSEAETNKLKNSTDILPESPNLGADFENDETVLMENSKLTPAEDEEAAKKDILSSSSNSDNDNEESGKGTSKRGDLQKNSGKNSKNIDKNKENEAKKDVLSDSSSNSDDDDVEEKNLKKSNNSSSTSLVKEEVSDSHLNGDNRKGKSSNKSSEDNSAKQVIKSEEIKAKKKFMLDTSSESDNDSDENEKDIRKLSNLNNLDRKNRSVYSSNDEVSNSEVKSDGGEIADQKKKRKLSLKKSNDKKLEQYLTDNDDASSEDLSFANFKSQMQEKEKSFGSKDEVAKKLLLASQSSDDGLEESDDDEIIFARDPKEKKKTKKKVEDMDVDDPSSDVDKKKRKTNSSEDDDKSKKKKGADWKNDRLLRGKLSATDTSDEERMIRKARKTYGQKEKKRAADSSSSGSDGVFRSQQPKKITKKRRRVVLLSSDSDAEREIVETLSSAASSDESDKKKKKMKKRKRIKTPRSEDSDVEEVDQSQSSLKGRKNIRQIMKKTDLEEQTRKTAKDEEARKKRLAERQALFNKVFEIQDTSDQVLKKLVLDYDIGTKKELVTVDPKLLEQLKPHQVKGVRFMWEACFESLKQVQNGKGGGCILAHCMGLGKTLQVITLVHTLLSHEETKVKTVLIICPLTTVFNWRAEFDKWLEPLDNYEDINVYDLTKFKNNAVRADHLKFWNKNGGVMILGYDSFRSLVNGKKLRSDIKKSITTSLLDPGPDLVICDEGHILKNSKSAISKATMDIKSLRRIVLTGTPLQNNLKEYHCMVQFVKPNLLGNQKEFQNRFVGPITNGQYVDSTIKDVRLMKRRAHVLHKMLDGIVQRFDYNVLKPFLPPKFEFVISVGLSDLQAQLYEYYIKNKSQVARDGGAMRLFKDYQIMRLIWTHPLAMKLSADRRQKIQDKEESDESMKNFVVSDSEDESKDSDSVVSLSSGDETNKNKGGGRLTRARKNELGIDLDEMNNSPPEVSNQWWSEFVSDEDLEDHRKGPKLMLLFAILRQCELIGDKVLIFSQSIPSLDMIEYFLTKNEEFSQRLPEDSSFVGEQEDYVGTWQKNCDYFRLDGQTPNDLRSKYCKIFNRPNNTRARLFLISTKAGGLGINLPSANRVIIFDASWNPSYDIQSIFRVYRFGQTKPCYIYRFLSQGTMEEKIYERQVTKLSVSCRVVDEQQIDRHFSRKDVAELYTFNRKPPMLDEIPKLPSDRLMAEMLKQYKDIIITYHEHDSLLENIEDEELTEEERKAAWKDYEDEKNRPALAAQQRIPTATSVYQEMTRNMNDDMILATIRKTHPNATQPQLMMMLSTVRQKLFDYYMFEQQRRMSTQVHTAAPSTFSNAPPNPVTERQMPERPVTDQPQMKQDTLLRALQQPSGQTAPQPTFVGIKSTSSNSNAEEVPSTSEPRDPLA